MTDVNQTAVRLWCLHHIGPDDVHPAPDFDTAQKWADYANKAFAEHVDLSRFVVAVWPWGADAHEEGLAASIAGWTVPESDETAVEAVARAIAKADGSDFDEPCGFETDADDCESSTCVAAGFEDHDPDYARSWYLSHARAAIAAMPANQTDQDKLVHELVAGLEQAQEWAAEERRWATTYDLDKWIGRDSALFDLLERARAQGGEA